MSIYRTKDIRSVARVFDVRPECMLAVVRDLNSLGDMTTSPSGAQERMACADRIYLPEEHGSYANSILTDLGIREVRDHYEALTKLNLTDAWDEAHAEIKRWASADAEIGARA